ncbi:MAG: glycosyltransferase family 4 protein, partial [Planctomycetota bacterium]
ADLHHGWGNITHEYCQALKKKGIDFLLLLPQNEPHYEYVRYPVEYVLPSYTTTLRNFSSFSYACYRLPKRLANFTLIHNLFDFPYCFIAYKIARQLKVPYLTGSQGTYGVLPLFHFWDRYFQEKSYRYAQKIVTPSHYTASLIQQYSKVKTPFQVIHNGVNYERFSTPVSPEIIQTIRQHYPGKFLILGVGGLKERKGFHIVIQALTFLRKYPLKYLIIGKGIMEKELKALVQKEGLQETVEFLGQKEGEDLVAHFQACDLYCHTPTHRDFHFEGFGIVFIEANAAGKPVVASNSGGVPDAVVHEKTGLLAPAESVEQTATAIETLLQKPALLQEMSQNAKIWAQKHDWSQITEQWISLYQECIKPPII